MLRYRFLPKSKSRQNPIMEDIIGLKNGMLDKNKTIIDAWFLEYSPYAVRLNFV